MPGTPGGDRDAARTQRARELVARHLLPGERIEVAVTAVFGDPPTRRSLVRNLERFVGLVLSRRRAAVLTTRRLLVLPLRAPDRDGDGWFTVQLQRGALRAVRWEERGGLRSVTLRTGVGERRLLARAGEDARLRQLARLLGAPEGVDPRPRRRPA